tara:strand:- start:101 stop:736 length:636 start_codon:yes stop_codon:yes gene_type:complete
MDRNRQIDTFCRYTQVSRETILSLEKYEEILIKSNKKLNLIGKSTIEEIWIRHFLDSAQVFDFINKNEHLVFDLGSGAGFPGLVLSILSLDKKIHLKVKLLEKSPKKSKFLKEVIHLLKLNAEVICQNIEEKDFKFEEGVFIARAFKPLAEILELIHSKAKNFKKIIIFLGKTGDKELLRASKNWDIKYKQRMSITSNDSLIIEINKLIKK